MRTLRSRVGVAVVDGKLYAFGGYDGNSRLCTVECYFPKASACVFTELHAVCVCVYLFSLPQVFI